VDLDVMRTDVDFNLVEVVLLHEEREDPINHKDVHYPKISSYLRARNP
jgi:hypothetical protein